VSFPRQGHWLLLPITRSMYARDFNRFTNRPRSQGREEACQYFHNCNSQGEHIRKQNSEQRLCYVHSDMYSASAHYGRSPYAPSDMLPLNIVELCFTPPCGGTIFLLVQLPARPQRGLQASLEGSKRAICHTKHGHAIRLRRCRSMPPHPDLGRSI